MRKIAASYIFPVSSPPIKFGIIYIDNNNKIIKIKDSNGNLTEEEGCELYNGAIIPGLVNAHTHLELSHLKEIYKSISGSAFKQQLGTPINAKIKACNIDKSGTDAASESKVVLARTLPSRKEEGVKPICLRQMSILAMERNADFGIYGSSQTGMQAFLHSMINKPPFDRQQIDLAISQADSEMFLQGISVAGNICNSAHTLQTVKESKIRYTTFVELLGINSSTATQATERGNVIIEQFRKHQLPVSLTPHGPYSVSPVLLNKIAQSDYSRTISIHTLETPVESEQLTESEKSLRQFFIKNGILTDKKYYQRLHPYEYILNNFTDRKVLLVHNTFAGKHDWEIALQTAQANNLTLFAVTCPRSNITINSVTPDYRRWSDKIPICIGTDSLASNSDLSVFEEIKFLLEHCNLPFQKVLTWATLNGAKALDADKTFGSLETGKSPGINLIEDFDFKNMKPLKSSTIRRIV